MVMSIAPPAGSFIRSACDLCDVPYNIRSLFSLHQVFNALIKDKEMEKSSSPSVKNS